MAQYLSRLMSEPWYQDEAISALVAHVMPSLVREGMLMASEISRMLA
jgi:hypothetical protein